MKGSQPDPAFWERLRTDPAEWNAYCGRVGLRFIGIAARRVRDTDDALSDAVLWTIEQEARSLEALGAPHELVAMFRRDYGDALVHQMDLVSIHLVMLARFDERPKRKPRAKPTAANATSGLSP